MPGNIFSSGGVFPGGGGSGVSTFLELSDVVPVSYLGQAGNAVVVNGTEDGLVFGSGPTASKLGTWDVAESYSPNDMVNYQGIIYKCILASTGDIPSSSPTYWSVYGLENIVDGTAAGQMLFWNGSTWTYTEVGELFWDDTNKRLGIGTNATTYGKLQLLETGTNANLVGAYFDIQNTVDANGENYNSGLRVLTYTNVASGFTDTGYAIGSIGVGYLQGDGTLSKAYGIMGRAGIASGAGVLTDAYGLYTDVLDIGGSGTITNSYCIYIGASAGTNKYGIYQVDTDGKNYLGSSLGIGTTDILNKLEVLHTAASPGRFTRSTADTSDPRNALVVRHLTSGTMADDFGVLIEFDISDGTDYVLGSIGAVREGADDQGALVFQTKLNAAEGWTEKMRLDRRGYLGIDVLPSNKLTVIATEAELSTILATRTSTGQDNIVLNALQLRHETDGTTAAGFGTLIQFDIKNSTATYENAAFGTAREDDDYSSAFVWYNRSGVGLLSERMRLTSDGSLLVNQTTLPYGSPKLSVDNHASVVSSAADARFVLAAFSANSAHSGVITFQKSHWDTKGTLVETVDTEVLGRINFNGIGTGSSEVSGAYIRAIQNGNAAAGYVPTQLQFYTDSTTAGDIRMVIDHNGYVGIGTLDPDAPLEVVNATLDPESNGIHTHNFASDGTLGGSLHMHGSRGTPASPGATLAGDQIARLCAGGYSSFDAGLHLGAAMMVIATEDWNSENSYGAKIEFWTNENNSPDALRKRMTIANDGLVSLQVGNGINEFSIDGTLSGNSDIAVPTEQAVKTYVDAPLEAFNEPTGFPNRTDSTLTFTDGTMTVSVAPTGASFDVWQAGVKYTFSTQQDFVIANTTGLHAVYFDSGVMGEYVNPSNAQTSDVIRNKVLVTYLYWNATLAQGIYVGEERHGTVMSGATHNYNHFKNGMIYNNGLGLSNMVVDGDGSVNTHTQFGVSAGGVSDEDIYRAISAVTSTTGLPIYYMSGASGDWYRTTNAGYSVLKTGVGGEDRLAWNQWTGATWQLTEAGDNSYVLCHVFATGEKDNQMIALVGQANYANINDARAGADTEVRALVTLGTLSPEVRPIATVIFQTRESYVNTMKARVVSTAEGDDYVDWRDDTISRVGISTTDHNSLTGIQGGAPGEYYHVISGLQGSVAFYDVSGEITEDNTNFFWDDTNKRLGIRTNSPGYSVHAVGTDLAQSSVGLTRTSADAFGPSVNFNKHRSTAIVQDGDNLGQINWYGYDGNSYPQGAQIRGVVDGTPGDQDIPTKIVFATTPDASDTPVDRMTIKNDGKVGIGTDTPAFKFVVSADGGIGDIISENFSNVDSQCGFFRGYRARGTKASPLAIQNADYIVAYHAQAYDGSSYGSAGQIDWRATQAWTPTAHGADLEFYTCPNDSATMAKVMTLGQDGKLSFLIGTGINEFSTDGTLVGNSDDAVPTEQAVKTYVDGKGHPDAGTAAGQMLFWTGSVWTYTEVSELFWDDTNKRIGIGTDTPITSITVYKEDGYAGARFVGFGSGFGTHSLYHANGTIASPSAVLADDELGRFTFGGYTGSGFSGHAWISGIAPANWSGASTPTEITFYTNPIGSGTPVERMRIANDGRVGIGSGAASPGRLLDVIDTTNPTIRSWYYGNVATTAGQLTLMRSRTGTPAVLSGDSLGVIEIRGYGTDADFAGAFIVGVATENWSNSAHGTKLDFYTNPNGGTAEALVMTIGQDGKVTLSSGTGINQFATTMTDTSNDEVPTSAAIKAYGDANWATSTPAGADGNIQYNNGGVMGGEAALFWDDTNDYLGVGTASPGVRVHVQGNGGANSQIWAERYSADAGAGAVIFQKSRGIGPYVAVNAGDTIGNILFQGHDGTNYASGIWLWGSVDGTPGTDDMPGRLDIMLSPSGSDTPVSRMTFRQDGKIGVGTTDPITALDVVRDDFAGVYTRSYGAAAYSLFIAQRGRGTEASPAVVQSGDQLGQFGFRGRRTSGDSIRAAMEGFATETWSDSANGSKISFFTCANGTGTNVTRMTIDQSGYVGIGYETPLTQLDIRDDGFATQLVIGHGTGATDRGNITAAKGRGTVASPTAIQSGDVIGQFGFMGRRTSGWSTRAGMLAYATENWTDSANGSEIRFFTCPTGSGTNAEVMTIGQDGKVTLSSGTGINQFATTMTDTSNDEVPTSAAIKTYGDANWATSSPAGSDGQVQYNNGGAMGGAAGIYWDDINSRVEIGAESQNSSYSTYLVNIFGANNTSSSLQLNANSTTASHHSYLKLSRSKGSAATPSPMLADEIIGAVYFAGWIGSSYFNTSAIMGKANQNYSDVATGGRIEFHTILDGTTTLLNRMTIEHDGAVTIGDAAAVGDFSVHRNAPASAYAIGHGATSNYRGSFTAAKARGSIGSLSAIQSGDEIGNFGFMGRAATIWGTMGRIQGFATENWTDSAMGTKIVFQNAPNGSATRVDRMTIDQNGYVGIGTTSPSTLLNLAAQDTSATTRNVGYGSGAGSRGFFSAGKARGTIASPTAVQTLDVLGYYGFMGYGATSFFTRAGMYGIASQNWTDSALGCEIHFYTTPNGSTTEASRMMITNDGKVGIGTTAPVFNLVVSEDGASNWLTSQKYSNSATEVGGFLSRNARGTEASPTNVQSGDYIGRILFQGYEDAFDFVSGASISAFASENWTAAPGRGARLEFQTTAIGSAANPSTRMTIIDSGEVGIGVTPYTGYTLDIGSTSIARARVRTFSATANFGGLVALAKSRGTEASPSPILSGDRLGYLGFQGQHNTSNGGWANGAYIICDATENFGETAHGSKLEFYVCANTETNPTLRMTIGQDGKVTLSSGTGINQFATTMTDTSNDEVPTSAAIKAYGDANWATSSPAGSDTQVQYNNGGAMGGAATFVWDDINSRVGIGATSPEHNLHVEGTAPVIQLRTTVLANAAQLMLYNSAASAVDGTDAGYVTFAAYSGTQRLNVGYIVGRVDGTIGASDMPGRLQFYTTPDGTTNPTLKMTIKNDGKIGMGTASPTHNLSVFSEAANAVVGAYTFLNVAGNQGTLALGHARGTEASPAAVQSGDSLGKISFEGHDSGAQGASAQIISYATKTWAVNDRGGNLKFYTVPNGGTSPTERMIIDQNGYIGVGTDTPLSEFHIHKDGSGVSARIASSTSAGAAGGGLLYLGRSRNTEASPAAIQSGDYIGRLAMLGHDGGGWAAQALIMSTATENWVNGTNRGCDIQFWTTPNAGVTWLQRMRLNNDGKLALGNYLGLDQEWNAGFTITDDGGTGLSGITLYRYSGDAAGNGLWASKARGSKASPTVPNENDTILYITGNVWDGDQNLNAAAIYFRVGGTISNNVAYGDISFFTADNSPGNTERMRLDSSGKLIIGDDFVPNSFANTAIQMVDIGSWEQATISGYCYQTGGSCGGLQMMKARGTKASPTVPVENDWIGSMVGNTWDGDQFLNTAGIAFSVGGTVSDNSTYGDIIFYTANASAGMSERMRLESSGRVGIGASSPEYKLDVSEAVNDVAASVRCFSDTTAAGPYIILQKSHNDSLGTLTTTIDTELLGEVSFCGIDSSNGIRYAALIRATQAGSAGASNVPAKLEFQTDSGTERSTRLLITHDGQVGIGGIADPGSVLHVLNSTVETTYQNGPTSLAIFDNSGTTSAASSYAGINFRNKYNTTYQYSFVMNEAYGDGSGQSRLHLGGWDGDSYEPMLIIDNATRKAVFGTTDMTWADEYRFHASGTCNVAFSATTDNSVTLTLTDGAVNTGGRITYDPVNDTLGIGHHSFGDNLEAWPGGGISIGAGSPSRKLHVLAADAPAVRLERTTATTNAVGRVAEFRMNCTGTAAAGFGADISLEAEDSAGTAVVAASISGVMVDVTPSSHDSRLDFYTAGGGSLLRRANIDSNGSFVIGPDVVSGQNPLLYLYGYDTGAAAQKFGRMIVSSNGDFVIESESGEKLGLGTSAARVMTIDSTWVGIGITTPERRLHVYGTTGNDAQIYLERTSTDTGPPALHFVKNRATGIVADDDQLGYIGFKGYDGNSDALGAAITAFVDGTPGDGDMPARLEFQTSADGSETPTTRLSILANSNLGYNTGTEFGSGVGVIGIANAGTNPSTNPTGGGILYSDAGAGKWRGSSGTVTTFGTAEPHCPVCGHDFMQEWENESKGEYLAVCMRCLTEELGERDYILRKKG